MDIRELLEKVRGGKLEIDAAEKYLRSHSGVRTYKEMGYAKLDLSLIHISEPTRGLLSRMPSSA